MSLPRTCPACGAARTREDCPRCRRVAAATERRLATVLFVDLTGYTDLHRRLDPEEVEAQVRPLLRRLRGIVHEHGGAVPSVAGDGFLAVFGVVLAHEDDALRAVTAALRALDLTRDGELQIHCGAATGELLVGPNEEGLSGWNVSGATVNLAARLSDAAAAGQILVDEQCAALVGDTATWEASPALTLKGLPEPVPVRYLTGLAASTEPVARTPFVNRVAELDALDAALTAVLGSSRAGGVLVLAEPGGGASRLVRHWASRQSGLRVLRGRCRSYGEDVPLQALLEAVTPLAQDLHEPDLARRLERLPVELTRPAAPGSGPEGRITEVRHLLGRALASAGLAGPVLLVVEDVHAAAPNVLDLLAELPRGLGATPLLLVCTGRTGEVSDRLSFPQVELPSLTATSAARLVDGLLDAPADAAVLHALEERAGGNPLLLEDCLAMLREQDALLVHDGWTTLVRRTALDAMPVAVEAWVGARLDALPDAERRLLQEASTCGDEVEPEWLAEMLPDDPEPALAALVARGLLVPERPPASALRFRSVLVREVARSRLPRAVRRQRHRLLMELVSTEARPALHALHALAAHDLTSVGSPERPQRAADAVRALTRAAEAAFAVQARTAEELVARALPLLDDLPATSTAASALLELAARVQTEVGRLDEAVQLARRAADAGGDDLDRARARLAEAQALDRTGAVAAARAIGRELEQALTGTGEDAGLLRGRALVVQAVTRRYDDMTAYVRGLEQAHHAFARTATPAAAVEAGRTALELAYLLTLEGGGAADRWWRRAELETGPEDLRGRASLLRSRSVVLLSRGEVARARDVAGEALGLADDIGARHPSIDAQLVLVESCTATGQLDRALAVRERLLGEAASGSPRLRLAVAAASALTLLRTAGAAAAEEELRSAEALGGALGHNEQHLVTSARAWTWLEQGGAEAAEAACDESDRLAAVLGWRAPVLASGTCRARARLLRGAEVDWAPLHALAAELRAGPYAAQLLLLERQAAWRAGRRPDGPPPLVDEDLPELVALRAEDAALAARHRSDAEREREAWEQAAAAWARLGSTAWRDRALQAAALEGSEPPQTFIGSDAPLNR